MSTIGPNQIPSQITAAEISASTTSAEQLEALQKYYQANTGVTSLEQVVQAIEQLQSNQAAWTQAGTPDPSIALTDSLVKDLISMVSSLQGVAAWGSSQSPQLASMMQQLTTLQAGLQQTPPQMLSDEQLTALTTDLQNLDIDSTQLPLSGQSQYWEQQGALFQTLGAQIGSLAQISSLTSSEQTLIQAATTLNSMGQAGAGAPSSSQLSTIVDNIMQILPQISSYSPSNQQMVLKNLENIFQGVQFNSCQPSAGQAANYSLSQLVAYGQIGQWATSYISSHPEATTTQLQTYLQQQSSTYLASDASISSPVLSSVTTALSGCLDDASFAQTLQNVGVQTASNGTVSIVGSKTDPVMQTISNLNIIQVSQPPATQGDPQVVAAQNTIAYINQQLAPYASQAQEYNVGIANITLPSSVLQNVVPALDQLIHIYNGSDPAAATVAGNYINSNALTDNFYVANTGALDNNYGLVELAQNYDVIKQAMSYATTHNPVTEQELQSYLKSYVNSLPSDAAGVNSYEQNLINNPGLGVHSMISSGSNMLLQMGTLQNGQVILPQTTAGIFQPPNQFALGVMQNNMPLPQSPGFAPVNIQTTASVPSWISLITPYQDSLTSLVQPINNAQVASAVQKALVDQQIAGSTTPTTPVTPATTPESTTQMLNNVANLVQSLYSEGAGGQSIAIKLAQALIAGVTQLIQSLQPYATTPQQTADLTGMLQQMQSMQSQLGQNPPQMPSSDSFNALNTDVQSLDANVTSFSPETQSNYWSSQASFLQVLGSQLTSLNAGSQLQQISSELSTMSQPPISAAPDNTQLATIMKSLLALLPEITTYSGSESASVLTQAQNLFQNVQFNAYQPENDVEAYQSSSDSGIIPTGTNYSSAQVVAYAQIAQWASSYIAANPSGTTTQLHTYLQQQSSTYLSSASSTPFIAQIQKAISSDLDSTNYSSTFGNLNIQIASNGVVSFQDPTVDAVTGMLSNLGIVQISQAPTTTQDPQVILAQNAMTYINEQLAPYYTYTGTGLDYGTEKSLPASVLANITPALQNLATLAGGTDSAAASMANAYLTNTQFQFGNPNQQALESTNLAQLAAYLDLADQAVKYANANPIVTVAGLQTALANYVNALPDNQSTAFEKNLITNPGLGSAIMLVSGDVQGQLMGADWTGSPNDPTLDATLFYSLVQLGTVSPPQGGVPSTIADVPATLNDLFNLSANQILMQTDTDTMTLDLPQVPGLQSVAAPKQVFSQQQMGILTPMQSQMTATLQQIMSVQTSAQNAASTAMPPSPPSLQDLFAQIILGHYMPEQEALLESQSNQLNWINWLGGQYTSLVSDTSSFASSNTVVNFAQKLGSPIASSITSVSINVGIFELPIPFADFTSMTPPVGNVAYNGSPQMAQQALAAEKAYVANGITSSTKAIAQIQSILSALQPPGTAQTSAFLSNPALATQIQTIKATLQSQLKDLQTTISNLSALGGTLNLIQIIPAPTTVVLNPMAYSPTPTAATGWNSATQFCIVTTPPQPMFSQNAGFVSVLGTQEGTLVNGSETTPSLSDIGQNISTSSQQTTSQSQTQQMELQLSMTEIQQEWSVVSSALQTLNQIYMAFARAISQ